MSVKAPQEMASDSWAGDIGDKWNAYLEQFESMIAPAGVAAISAANFKTGESVIDIGSGGGGTSLQISELVSSTGHVTGLDLSETLVNTAQGRAQALQLKNVKFIQGDASQADLAGQQYDCLFSRFGVMFFEDPYAAFKHMRSFVKPGGRISFACWGPPAENPWVFTLMEVAKKYVELPPSEPKAPGPFAFEDVGYVADILTKAGFSNVEYSSWQGSQYVGGLGATPEIAAQFLMEALFVGDLLKDESEEIKARAYQDLIAVLADYQTDEGIALQGSIWLVSAAN